MLAHQHCSVTALHSCHTLCKTRAFVSMPCSLSTLLLQNSQFWLAQCQADNSLLEGCARATGQRLLHGLWPLEDPRSASPQVIHIVPCQAVVYHIPHSQGQFPARQYAKCHCVICILHALQNIAYISKVTFCSCCRLLMPLSGWQK